MTEFGKKSFKPAAELYSEPSQTSETKHPTDTVNNYSC